MLRAIPTEQGTLAGPDGDRLLDIGEVASLLGLGTRTVWRHASTGRIPRPVSLGRARRWRRAAILDFIRSLDAEPRGSGGGK